MFERATHQQSPDVPDRIPSDEATYIDQAAGELADSALSALAYKDAPPDSVWNTDRVHLQEVAAAARERYGLSDAHAPAILEAAKAKLKLKLEEGTKH